jgi:hypothetical protein
VNGTGTQIASQSSAGHTEAGQSILEKAAKIRDDIQKLMIAQKQ